MSDLNAALLALLKSLPEDQRKALASAISPASPPSETRKATKSETPLAQYLRQITQKQRESLAAAARRETGMSTSVIYLYQMSAHARPNPSLRLATALIEEMRRLEPATGIAPLTFADLLVGDENGRDNTAPRRKRAPNS
jgi:hypothetical protein